MDFDTPRLLELLRNPAEDLSFEIKEWLDLRDNVHKAKLAQAIIALANHGGGALLLGYAQQADGAFIPAEPRPANLSGYSADIVNDISRSYFESSSTLRSATRCPSSITRLVSSHQCARRTSDPNHGA